MAGLIPGLDPCWLIHPFLPKEILGIEPIEVFGTGVEQLDLTTGSFVAGAPGETLVHFTAYSLVKSGGLLSLKIGTPDFLHASKTIQVLESDPGTVPVPGMVLIQPGTFMMGSNAPGGAPYFGNDNHKPVHQVTISQPFWMGRYEVTQAEYEALMGTNPSQFVGANHPVERVSWFDAMAYCEALNAQQTALGNVPPGYQFRLPTEAEWEYACRAGTTTEFHYGEAPFCNQSRFLFSSHSTPAASCNYPVGTAPVGSYLPNARGLYDMHGNVREWVLDSYSFYTDSSKTDPFMSGGQQRIGRGGGWGDNSQGCRSAVAVASSPPGRRYLGPPSWGHEAAPPAARHSAPARAA